MMGCFVFQAASRECGLRRKHLVKKPFSTSNGQVRRFTPHEHMANWDSAANPASQRPRKGSCKKPTQPTSACCDLSRNFSFAHLQNPRGQNKCSLDVMAKKTELQPEAAKLHSQVQADKEKTHEPSCSARPACIPPLTIPCTPAKHPPYILHVNYLQNNTMSQYDHVNKKHNADMATSNHTIAKMSKT